MTLLDNAPIRHSSTGFALPEPDTRSAWAIFWLALLLVIAILSVSIGIGFGWQLGLTMMLAGNVVVPAVVWLAGRA